MSDAKTSSWPFWRPLSFWKVLGIFTITNVVALFIVVTLREGLGLTSVPIAGAGGAGGLLGVLIVSNLARKARDDAGGV